MNTRVKISAVLIILGLLLAFLPSRETRLIKAKPDRLVNQLNDEKNWFTVDQVARFVVNEDQTVQLIDLRPKEEFLKMNIPGSVNIPFGDFSKRIPANFSADKNMKNILFANDDSNAREAFIIARGLNYRNTFLMKGGLDEWQKTMINTNFTGEKLSARENALFEIRSRAGRMFAEFNSMPDSLKQKYFASRQLARKKLDGGCE